MFIVKILTEDLVDAYAKGDPDPGHVLLLQPTLVDDLDDEALKVRDLVAIGDGMAQLLVERPTGHRFAMTLDMAGSEWYGTTSETIRALGA